MSVTAVQPRPFASLMKKLRAKYDAEPYQPRDPLTQLVLGFLQWDATRKQAEAALGRIQAAVVDHNELRVSHHGEIVAMIGPAYPRGEERIARLREVLQEIYIREHAMSLEGPAAKGRKELRAYVESLPGITPYVAAYLLLTGFHVPAIPVDDKLSASLVAEGVADEQSDPAHVAVALDKLVKADDALDTHLLLQAWSDDRKAGKSTGARKPNTVKKKK